MNEPGPKLSPLPIRVALAGVILAVSINSRVFAQDTSSDTNGTSISTSTDTATGPATESSPVNTSTDTASDSVTPPATPSGSPPDASATAAATSGTGNPGDYEGPVGVTGIFNGNVATGCSYDPLTHSAHRVVDDIVVPGSVGKYPLKMTRYYNSRAQYYALSAIGLGHGWAHEYSWLLWSAGRKVVSPHGSVYDNSCEDPVGVSEGWEGTHSGLNGTWRLADGGRVFFENARARYIDDPYGLRTTITYDAATGLRTRVTEPGGRYLAFTYADSDPDGTLLLTGVEAHGLGNATVTDWVNYSYTLVSPGGSGASMKMLSGVNYSDGTSATYTYRTDNVTEDTALGTFKIRPLLQTCNDVRYSGPMRQIVYQYQSGGPHGVILSEKNLSTGSAVSTIAPGLPTYGLPSYDPPTLFTETRGDSPTRTFTYTRLRSQRNTEGGVCPDYSDDPHQQMLLSYTDFQGKTTYIGYDPNWYVGSVTDARGAYLGDAAYTTSYLHGPPPPQGIGEILQITHPDGSYIAYSYFPDPHYLQNVTDERRNLTTYKRDSNNRIFEIDHPDGGVETFSYNPFGQVLTHRLANNSDVNGTAQARYKHFQYDLRGLLTAEWNPTTNSTPLASDPKTTYTYYNGSDPVANYGWIDRVKTKTPPANAQGKIAAETYEYDHAFDPNGNVMTTPAPGRGLMTKILFPNDTTSKSFEYDKYGNKVWEENELLQRTNYTYDNYNRLKTVTLPSPAGTTTYDYLSYLHTTNSAYFVTDPVGIVTANTYDDDWRKTSTTVSSAITRFGYDAVGNPTQVTDPRGTALGDATYTTFTGYDARNRKTSMTDPQGHVTSFYYEDNINLTRIVRPDGSAETKHYDLMNRVDSDTVPKTGPPASPTETITTTFAYNPSGSLQSVTVPQTPSLNLTTRFGYDPSDLKTTMRYPNGSGTQGWTYDKVKNLSSRRTVNGTTQSFTYDSRNRKIGMTWSNTADSATFAYDAAGRLITANNPNSAITRQYDAAGRLTLDRQKVGTLAFKDVQYSYDAAGKQTHLYLTSAAYDYTFSYDPMGRFEKISVTSPPSLWFQYYYDLASNETQRFNYLNSVTQIYTPDNLNRMSGRDVKKGTTPLSSEVYGYDAMSRLNSVVREDGYTDQFGYYLDGELYWAKYNLAATPTPTPSPTASPTPTPTPTPAAQVATPGFSGPASLTCAYSVTVAISTTTSGAQIRYTIDDTTPTSTHGTLISGSSGSATFSIAGGTTLQAMAFKSGMTDSAVRSGYWERDCGQSPDATEAWNSPRDVTYTIDKSGNRTQVADTGVTKSYVVNNLNQYTSAQGSAVTLGSEHEIAAFQNINYTYINDERLKTVKIGTTNSYTLAYDALGRCVQRTLIVNGGTPVTTYYIYDGEKPIVEYSAAGAILAKNLYGKGIDEILRRDDYTVMPTRTVYYQQDHEGSVTHLTDATGAVVEKYKYDVFGAPTIYNASNTQLTTSAYKNRFLFTGREYASSFAIYEYRARAYHPGLGRFTSEDPMGFAAGDYNLFRYCHNDPEDLTDPMGLVQEQTGVTYLSYAAKVMALERLENTKILMGYGAIAIGKLNYRIGQLAKTNIFLWPDRRVQITKDPIFVRDKYGQPHPAQAKTEAVLDKPQAERNPVTGRMEVFQRVGLTTTFREGSSPALVNKEMERPEAFVNEWIHGEARPIIHDLEKVEFRSAVRAEQAVDNALRPSFDDFRGRMFMKFDQNLTGEQQY